MGLIKAPRNFDFNENLAFNNQISKIIAYNYSFVGNLERNLLSNLQALASQFNGESVLVDLFQKSSPQCVADFIGTDYD